MGVVVEVDEIYVANAAQQESEGLVVIVVRRSAARCADIGGAEAGVSSAIAGGGAAQAQGETARSDVRSVVVGNVGKVGLDVFKTAAELPGMASLSPGKVVSDYRDGDAAGLRVGVEVERRGKSGPSAVTKGKEGRTVWIVAVGEGVFLNGLTRSRRDWFCWCRLPSCGR